MKKIIVLIGIMVFSLNVFADSEEKDSDFKYRHPIRNMEILDTDNNQNDSDIKKRLKERDFDMVDSNDKNSDFKYRHPTVENRAKSNHEYFDR